ncbi:MAG: hypothetical protein ACU85U_17925 [Gammaproteobacteria bacterium]|jgi:hypothetical protein
MDQALKLAGRSAALSVARLHNSSRNKGRPAASGSDVFHDIRTK